MTLKIEKDKKERHLIKDMKNLFLIFMLFLDYYSLDNGFGERILLGND
jgi:hypothetical protein